MRQVTTFTIPGHAVGYYTHGARPNWDRMKAYRAYLKHVRECATLAGITLPLEATEEAPIIISTRLYSQKRVHHDPENCHKGICDALFYQAKGGDKHVGGRFEPATYEEGDRVEVTIERIERAGIVRPPKASRRASSRRPSASSKEPAW